MSGEIERGIYVFPAKGSAAFAAVNISDGVLARRHWAVVRLAFDDIYPVEMICKLNDRTLRHCQRQWMTVG
jgi:hypothetical protein